MKTRLVFYSALLYFSGVYSQSTRTPSDTVNVFPTDCEPPDYNKVYITGEPGPIFRGNINTWLSENIVYPKDAETNKIQGIVYVSFIVEKDGSVSNFKVLRGVQGGKSLENEALRVVSIMPKWTPGMLMGKCIKVAYILPIYFRYSDTTAPH